MDDVAPMRTASLSGAAKEQLFRDTQTFRDKTAALEQTKVRVLTWVCGIEFVALVAVTLGAASLFPLKTREIEYFVVDQARGYVGPAASAADAPKLFKDQQAEADVLKYVELRENYQYETDDLAFHLVTIMSSPDEQKQYKEMHDARTAAAKSLGDHGYVRIGDVQMWLIGDGRRQSRQYVVKFTRRQIMAGQPVPTHGEPCTAEVTFEYHPEYLMSREDRRHNPTGFLAVSYKSHADGEKSH